MRRPTALAGACVLTLAGVSVFAQQGRGAAAPQTPTLQSAVAALDATALRTVRFTATGRSYVLGQPPTAADPWPMRQIKSYTAELNFVPGAIRIEQVVTMPTPAPRGGGGAIAGEQRQVLFARGAYAWSQTQPAGGAPAFQPQPNAAVERLLWIWAATPQGALKAAGATLAQPVDDGAEIRLTLGGRYPFHVHINRMNQVDHVRAWMANEVLGDMLVETTYSGYRDFNGVLFPSRIQQSQGGHPTLDLTITAVEANPFIDIVVPDEVRAASFSDPAVTATSEKVGDGIFWIRGGSHHSLAVDMGDHVVVVEAPQHEARSDAVIAEVKKQLANKPIRFVINTHLHFDHSGGLRRYVDEGATVVTHAANIAFFEQAWAGPRTLSPDSLAKSGKKPVFQGVTDRTTLRGSNNRTIEVHVLQGNPHNEQTLVAWLPAERILFQSDMMNPPAQDAKVPPPTPTITNFYDNLARLNLDPERIVGGHGTRIATRADLNAVAGKAGTN